MKYSQTVLDLTKQIMDIEEALARTENKQKLLQERESQLMMLGYVCKVKTNHLAGQGVQIQFQAILSAANKIYQTAKQEVIARRK